MNDTYRQTSPCTSEVIGGNFRNVFYLHIALLTINTEDQPAVLEISCPLNIILMLPEYRPAFKILTLLRGYLLCQNSE